MAAKKRFHPGSKAARDRISAKISHLIEMGEAKSRDQAVAMAHSMEEQRQKKKKHGRRS